ncbi:hypothetical protein EJB05_49866, partial [Eragrostis curvula]
MVHRPPFLPTTHPQGPPRRTDTPQIQIHPSLRRRDCVPPFPLLARRHARRPVHLWTGAGRRSIWARPDFVSFPLLK